MMVSSSHSPVMIEGKGNSHCHDCPQEQASVKHALLSTSCNEKRCIVQRNNTLDPSATHGLPLSLACNAALNFVGSIGSAVQYCMEEIMMRTTDQTKYNGTDDLLAMTTFDTFELQLMNDVQLYNRMNSWETNGTFTTVGTVNTMNTDLAPVQSSLDFSLHDSKTETGDPSEHVCKDTPEQSAKDKTKQKKNKRVVNFEYPPISSMKECPRLTEEEKKKLFFTEEELDLYEADRKQILCDDIEVIAIEFTDSEESSRHEDRCDRESKRSETFTSPRMGGDSKKFSRQSSLRTGLRYNQSSETLETLGKTREAPYSALNQKKSPTKQRSKSDVTTSSHKRASDGVGKVGKMKGVQIFLRQRSLG